MSFNFSVAFKTIAGFVLLAIVIIIVGAGGLNGIDDLNHQVQKITDKNIPQLSARFEQSLTVSQANEALLVYLQSDDEKKMKQQIAQFEERFKQFASIIEREQSSQSVSQETVTEQAEVEQVKASFNAYYQHATKLIAHHKTQLALDYQITDELQKVQTNLETINKFSEKISGLIRNNKPATQAMRKLITSANQVRIAFRQYQLNGDIQRLQSQGTRLREQIQKEFDAFLKLEKKAKFLKKNIDKLISLIQPNEGLLKSYATLDTLEKEIDMQMAAAFSKLAITQSNSQVLIDQAIAGAQQSREQSNDVFSTTRTLILVLIIVALIIACATGFGVYTAIQKPLRRISKQLKVLGAGDMSVQFDEKRNDEFGHLGHDLNLLVQNLRTLLQQIVDKSTELEDTAKTNTQISFDTTASMQQQGEQLKATSQSADLLKQSVESVAQQVSATLDAVTVCQGLTEQADNHVNQTSGSITSQAQEIASVVEQSKQLEKNSQQIDTILVTINAIAEQTNLLALNAAIEAARAGEHGRGFAVVADEVRALASRTQNSTAEIQSTVERMKSQIATVSTSLQSTHSKAVGCVDLANASGESLNELQNAISAIQQMSTDINAVTQQQFATVLDVNQHIEAINGVADQTAKSAKEAESSSHQLLEISKVQHNLTNKFSF